MNTHTPQGESKFCHKQDAYEYTLLVCDELDNHPLKKNKFLKIIAEMPELSVSFNSETYTARKLKLQQEIENHIRYYILHVASILKDNTKLISGFNLLLPDGFEIVISASHSQRRKYQYRLPLYQKPIHFSPPDLTSSRTFIYDVEFRDSDGFRAPRECTDVIICEGITNITADAFNGCKFLINVTIPDSITRIGRSAFQGCAALEFVKMPEATIEIGAYAFKDCCELNSVIFSESSTLTKLGKYAFHKCKNLQNINIPDGVQKIEKCTFQECTTLQYIEIPAAATEISSQAFNKCTSLQHVVIPLNVDEIGEFAFDGCTGIQSLHISDSVSNIGHGAFSGCNSLQYIRIPDSVTKLGYCAFSCCSSLKYVQLPPCHVKFAFDHLRECTMLQAIFFYPPLGLSGKPITGFNETEMFKKINIISTNTSGSIPRTTNRLLSQMNDHSASMKYALEGAKMFYANESNKIPETFDIALLLFLSGASVDGSSVAAYLRQSPGAASVTDSSNKTALHWICSSLPYSLKSLGVIGAYLDSPHGPLAASILDADGMTPLDYLCAFLHSSSPLGTDHSSQRSLDIIRGFRSASFGETMLPLMDWWYSHVDHVHA